MRKKLDFFTGPSVRGAEVRTHSVGLVDPKINAQKQSIWSSPW